MAFSNNGSSREAIQAIQFELWPDCTTGCKFCYLNGTRRKTSVNEKSANLIDALATIKNKEIIKDYNAVGLIGGEFFAGQLRGLYSEWGNLVSYIGELLRSKAIKEFWIASSLINIIQGDIIGTLFPFTQFELDEDQRVTLCTSYDTVGRFTLPYTLDDAEDYDIANWMRETNSATYEELVQKCLYNEEKVEEWINNIRFIKENYPFITIHVQTILTQDLIEKLTANPNYLDFITDLGCVIDFRYPSITRADCPTATVIEDYRSILLEKYKTFPPKFFIESRASFLRFLPIFANKYGLEKVRNLIHQPEMRSRRLKIYVDNAEIEDRWNDSRDVYLECGHLVDGLCYIDDDTHCIYCDIEKFLNTQEESVD